MTEQKFLSLLSGLDPALIEESAPDAPGAETVGGKRPPSRRTRVLRAALIAAALCALTAAALWGIPALRRNSGDPITPPGTTEPDGTVEYTPLPLPTSADNAGFPLVFVSGSNASPEGGASADAAPPAPKFDYLNFVVRAAAVEVLPDTYCKFTAAPVVRPTEYRLVRFRTLSVLRGEGMPDEFFYLIRASLLADAEKPLTDYGSFWIGMKQIGTDNFVLRNATRGTAEVLPLLLFADSGEQPELGSLIAFTADGVFDETLWQAKSWLFGYQFIRHALENGESAYFDLPVERGIKTEECEARIRALIGVWEKEWSDRGAPRTPPAVFRLADLTTEEARTAADFAAPFKNGVFAQSFTGGAITYRRFIRGCETEQTIVIHLNNGERVTYSDEKYSPDDLAAAGAIDLPVVIASLAAAYREEAPLPPHLGATDLPLTCLAVTGWYSKDSTGKVCAVVKTIWIYLDRDQWTAYYDDCYRLCTAQGIREISRDDLLTAVGPRGVWQYPYGVGIAIAM